MVLSSCTLAVVCGLGTLRWGAELPRWSLRLLVAQGGLMVAVSVVLAPAPTAALALDSTFAFCAVDAVFFVPLGAALLRTGGPASEDDGERLVLGRDEGRGGPRRPPSARAWRWTASSRHQPARA